jgi:allantoin racemase
MLGLAGALAEKMAAKGVPVPVIDPTASAIGYLELLIRNGWKQSPLTYMTPPEKERRF